MKLEKWVLLINLEVFFLFIMKYNVVCGFILIEKYKCWVDF